MEKCLRHADPTLPPPSGSSTIPGTGARRNRTSRYHEPRLVELIFLCWSERERMCAKRLAIQIPDWLSSYEAVHGRVDESMRCLLLSISAASIDRVLKSKRDVWYATHRAPTASHATETPADSSDA